MNASTSSQAAHDSQWLKSVIPMVRSAWRRPSSFSPTRMLIWSAQGKKVARASRQECWKLVLPAAQLTYWPKQYLLLAKRPSATAAAAAIDAGARLLHCAVSLLLLLLLLQTGHCKWYGCSCCTFTEPEQATAVAAAAWRMVSKSQRPSPLNVAPGRRS